MNDKKISMRVDKNITNRYFYDYVNSLDMWCAVNCSKAYNIIVSKAPVYTFPTEVVIEFTDESEAAYFKLSPFWVEEIRE